MRHYQGGYGPWGSPANLRVLYGESKSGVRGTPNLSAAYWYVTSRAKRHILAKRFRNTLATAFGRRAIIYLALYYTSQRNTLV